MLEKDIENLIARYPEEFLPYKDLQLVGQQVRIENYPLDIVFKNNANEKVIVEVKRGILSRNAIPQIMDYYGVMKSKNPNNKIHLVVAANVIPKERVIFLSEQLGIDFVPIPVNKVLNVAKKYSYQFLDEEQPNVKQEYRKTAATIDKRVSKKSTNVWIFQSNPNRFDILNALEHLDEDVWGVRRFKEEIKEGDIGIIWMSGKESGIYAISDIITNPDYLAESKEVARFWHSDDDKSQIKLRVKLRYKIKLQNNPIFRPELKNIPRLKGMSIFRQPQGTNFRVTESEWSIISDLIKERMT